MLPLENARVLAANCGFHSSRPSRMIAVSVPINLPMKYFVRIVAASMTVSFFAPCAFAAEPAASATPAPHRAEGAGGSERKLFDETYQFIFFATLEGLYRDGVSGADVESLLATKGTQGGYLNFIYTCPICMPVEGAIVTYKLRPRIDHLKVENYQTQEHTFGLGLVKEVSEDLRSDKASVRLKAVNELVSKWISYRMNHSSLTNAQKKSLVEELQKRRKEGMNALRNFAAGSNGPKSMEAFAAGYEGGDECAVCNAALQMPLKLKAR